MKVLYRGKNFVDAGMIYGAFTTETKARDYAARVAARDGVSQLDLHTVDVLVDPEFHAAPTEVVDNRNVKQ